MQTHFAVIYHAGDPGADHPDPELRGRGPSLELIAAGPEERYRTGAGEDVLVRQGWHRVEHVRPIEGTEIKGPENP